MNFFTTLALLLIGVALGLWWAACAFFFWWIT